MRQLKITKQITNRDSQSFNKYLTDVSNNGDVISPEEELELAQKVKQGDMEARDKLVKANLRFVISVAKQYSGKAPLSDLVQEGNTGLITAAERFDETRGFKFITYAVWWIRQCIMQYISDNERKIRIPLNKVAIINKIAQARTALEQILEREATHEEITDYIVEKEPGEYTDNEIDKATKFLTNILEDKPTDEEVWEYLDREYREKMLYKIKTLITQSQYVGSIDAPMTTESDAGTMLDVLESEDNFGRMMQNKDLQTELKRVLEKVTFREREVLIRYYGLFGTPQASMEEIGERYELTRERVRQIKEKALRKLRYTNRKRTLTEYR